ncbi:MAG: hypothetical protein ACREJ4_13560 [Candidatus Methylomirabilaceae bacterium]
MPKTLSPDNLRMDSAARIALFVLRATAGGSRVSGGAKFAFIPSTHRLGENEAREALARFEKPVTCAAQLADDTILVRCNSNEEPRLVELHEQVFGEHLRTLQEHVAGRHRALSDDDLILLRAGEDTLLTTVRNLAQFQHDYFISYASRIDEPGAAALSLGAVAEYSLWPTAAWTLGGSDVTLGPLTAPLLDIKGGSPGSESGQR